MDKLRLLDLFSGIGGFSLGLERTGGFETVAFCEIEEFPRKVLKKHWPEVPQYEDIRELHYGAPVDVVTAGFPCQDISLAGKGAGIAGERSRLFWHVVRTICMVGRPLVMLENVAALLNRGMGTVLGRRWPTAGMMRNGIAYQRVTLVPRMGVTASGLLPTPSGTSNHGKNHVSGRLDEWGGSSNPWRGKAVGKLHCPRFEEWMMGYPDRWTELTDSETQ